MNEWMNEWVNEWMNELLGTYDDNLKCSWRKHLCYQSSHPLLDCMIACLLAALFFQIAFQNSKFKIQKSSFSIDGWHITGSDIYPKYLYVFTCSMWLLSFEFCGIRSGCNFSLKSLPENSIHFIFDALTGNLFAMNHLSIKHISALKSSEISDTLLPFMKMAVSSASRKATDFLSVGGRSFM